MSEETQPTQSTMDFHPKDVDKLTQELIDLVTGKEITPSNILIIVTQLMTVTAKYANLSGQKKKELIIHVLRNFVSQSTSIPSDSKNEILVMFDFIIPMTIDLLIEASKSKFVFKIKKNILECCATSLLY
jgi:hypothetical protein